MGIDERRENEREKKPPETEGANRLDGGEADSIALSLPNLAHLALNQWWGKSIESNGIAAAQKD
jgi:hypothetical protein